MKTFIYVFYLITVPDILDLDKMAFHRLAFENQETCLDLAHTLGQEIDPSARKQQCQRIIVHHPVPLPKPDFMD
tara:strand:+ start:487 stop:708 length:222 start_codon:yes stop_codon:yes gene_type:complete